jgi:hypothetical protein
MSHFHYENATIAVHARSRQWWVILFSLMVSPKVVIAVFALLPLAALAWCFLGRGSTDGGFVTIHDFPALVSALQTKSAKGSFWVVRIPGTAKSDGDNANLQYSFEDGVVGVDWVLLAERNLDDKDRFLDFVHRAGATAEEKEGNGVRYLRATGARDIGAMGQKFLQEIYGVKPEDNLQLIITGFEWRKAPNATPTT